MSNLHEQIGDVCVSMKSKIEDLSSQCQLGELLSPKIFVTDTTKFQLNDYSQKLGKWISKTEITILNHLKTSSDLKQYFSKMESPHKTKSDASSLMKHPVNNSCVILQIILWSCISKTCNESIVNALYGCAETITIPQKDATPTNKSLWNWLHRMSYCIRFAVFYSSIRLKTSHKGSRLLDRNYSTLVELACMEENVKRTAELFSIIGKNGLPLKSVTNAPSHELIMKDIRVQFNVDHDRDLEMSFVARETYLNYMKSPEKNYILHKPKLDENKFAFDCDILSFMLNFEEIQKAHSALQAFAANDVIKNFFEETKVRNNDNTLLFDEPTIRKDHSTQDISIKTMLTEVMDLVSIKVEGNPSLRGIWDSGTLKMQELFGENQVVDHDNIRRFIVMSLCGSSLLSSINKGTKVRLNKGTKDHCFYVMKRCFTNAFIQARRKPTDVVMEMEQSKQLVRTVFNELSKTLLCDDYFNESYLEEIRSDLEKNHSKTNLLQDGVNENLWKTHFMDMVKLSYLTTILPIKRSTEMAESTKVKSELTNWKTISENVEKWATNSDALEKTDITKCAILNLCVINIADQEQLTPIGSMCMAQQIICFFINDALQKATSPVESSNYGDQRMPKKKYFLRSVMKYLSCTMFKDVGFIPAFCEMLAKKPQLVYTDDRFWKTQFNTFNWNFIGNKTKLSVDIGEDIGDGRDQKSKRKHITTPIDNESTVDNSKSQKTKKKQMQHKKSKKQAATQNEKSDTFKRFFGDKNLSERGTAPNHNDVESKQQKKKEPESSPKKVTDLRRSTRGKGNSPSKKK